MGTLTLKGFSLRYGGSPSIISIAIIPRDQMSTLGPYALRVTTSGAIQYGVPTMVLLLLCSGVICAQNPKSARNRERRDTLRRVRQEGLCTCTRPPRFTLCDPSQQSRSHLTATSPLLVQPWREAGGIYRTSLASRLRLKPNGQSPAGHFGLNCLALYI